MQRGSESSRGASAVAPVTYRGALGREGGATVEEAMLIMLCMLYVQGRCVPGC